MQLKIDENLPVEVATLFRNAGHDALTVLDQKLGGRADQVSGDIIRAEQRALITLDLDFADIRAFPPSEFHGLIVFRLTSQDKITILTAVNRVLLFLNTEPLVGMLWIVDKNAIRIRGEKH